MLMSEGERGRVEGKRWGGKLDEVGKGRGQQSVTGRLIAPLFDQAVFRSVQRSGEIGTREKRSFAG